MCIRDRLSASRNLSVLASRLPTLHARAIGTLSRRLPVQARRDIQAAVSYTHLDVYKRQVRWLQRLAGVRIDGQLGPVTLAALRSADEASLIERLLALRLDLYAEHDRFVAFGRGWTRRIAENLRYAARDLA